MAILGEGDFHLIYQPHQDLYLLIWNGRTLIQIKRSDWNNFMEWMHGKWREQDFNSVELVYWEKNNCNVLVVPDNLGYMFCTLCIGRDNWEQFIEFLEKEYESIRIKIYNKITEIQQREECDWENAVNILMKEEEPWKSNIKNIPYQNQDFE